MNVKRLGLALLLAATALQFEGCGSSSTNSNNSVVAGYSISGCTTPNSGQATQCIPTLGNYGSNVVYEGSAIITNTNAAQKLIGSYPGYYGSGIPGAALKFATIAVSLTATNQGPYVSMAIQFAGVGQWISGYTTFANTFSTSQSAGTITMQTTGTAFNNSMSLTSTQPWDGSVYSMIAVPIMINGQNAGSVGLTRTQ